LESHLLFFCSSFVGYLAIIKDLAQPTTMHFAPLLVVLSRIWVFHLRGKEELVVVSPFRLTLHFLQSRLTFQFTRSKLFLWLICLCIFQFISPSVDIMFLFFS